MSFNTDIIYTEDREKLEEQKRIEKVELFIKKRFASIFRKPISTLNKDDISFLRARSSYLTAGEREQYKDVLNLKKEENKK